MSLALRTVMSMCSSGGSRVSSYDVMSASPMWACDSTSPGISVRPAPSITVAPSTRGGVVPGVTSVIRLPSTLTEPANASRPLPSNTRTLVIR